MTVFADVSWIVSAFVDREPESFGWKSEWSHGSVQFWDRILTIAAYCLKYFAGDIAEIGCFTGATTRALATLAKAYDRRVIAVDPWEPGTQNCEGWEYEAFLQNTKEFTDRIDVLRKDSRDKEVVKYLKARTLAFALVDGLHEHEACLSDINAVGHCQGVIAVDDILWNKSVEKAFLDGANVLNRKTIMHVLCKEGYLV